MRLPQSCAPGRSRRDVRRALGGTRSPLSPKNDARISTAPRGSRTRCRRAPRTCCRRFSRWRRARTRPASRSSRAPDPVQDKGRRTIDEEAPNGVAVAVEDRGEGVWHGCRSAPSLGRRDRRSRPSRQDRSRRYRSPGALGVRTPGSGRSRLAAHRRWGTRREKRRGMRSLRSRFRRDGRRRPGRAGSYRAGEGWRSRSARPHPCLTRAAACRSSLPCQAKSAAGLPVGSRKWDIADAPE